jgi:hypothetical protein
MVKDNIFNVENLLNFIINIYSRIIKNNIFYYVESHEKKIFKNITNF